MPNQVTLYAYPLVFHEVMKADIGLFAQDQWTIDRLTLNMAIRYDYFNAYVPAQVHPAGPFIGERNFQEVTCVPCWNDISPRFSAAYNLFGNGKTALKVSVGKYMAQELLTLATANNPISASNPSATRSWTTDDGDFIPEENELGPLSNSQFGTVAITTRYDNEVLRDNRQFNWKYSAGIQHEILPRTAIGLTYFRTTWHNFRATQNLANTPADYDPYSFIAPVNPDLPGGGGYLVDGLYNISEAKFGLQDNVVRLASNFGKQEEVYDGVDFSISSRLPGGTFIGGGFNTGRTRTSECFVINSPQALRFCENNPPFRTQLKLNGAYSLPWELKASAVFQSIPGVSYNSNYTASNAQIRPIAWPPALGQGGERHREPHRDQFAVRGPDHSARPSLQPVVRGGECPAPGHVRRLQLAQRVGDPRRQQHLRQFVAQPVGHSRCEDFQVRRTVRLLTMEFKIEDFRFKIADRTRAAISASGPNLKSEI